MSDESTFCKLCGERHDSRGCSCNPRPLVVLLAQSLFYRLADEIPDAEKRSGAIYGALAAIASELREGDVLEFSNAAFTCTFKHKGA